MSNLSSKILSYSPQVYYKFNQAYTTTQTNYGSTGNVTFALTNETPTYISNGGIHSEGSWQFGFGRGIQDSTVSTIAVSSNTSPINTIFADNDYSGGFWFKTNFTLQNSNAQATSWLIGTFGGSSTVRSISISILGGVANAGTKGKLSFTTVSGTAITSPNRIDDQNWHYIAFRAVPNGSSATMTYYIDGNLVTGSSSPTASTGLVAVTRFGGTSQSTTSPSNDWTTIEFSDYYVVPSATIGSTEIQEIWNSATTQSVTYSQTSAEANALQAEPTIATTAGDHVEITTSFLANATSPSGTSVGSSLNVEIVIDGALSASTEMINNVDISTGSDVSFSVIEFTAQATIVQAHVSYDPMLASAASGNHSVYVTPSYYSLVKSSNPLFYTNFEDSTITNFGSWSGVTYTVGSSVTKNNISTGDMGMIAGGESWKFTGTTLNSPNYVDVIPTNPTTTLRDLVMSDFTAEYWFKSDKTARGVGLDIGPFTVAYTPQTSGTYYYESATNANSMLVLIDNVVPNDVNSLDRWTTTKRFPAPAETIIFNDWNHIVLKSTGSSFSLYINGSIAVTGTYQQDNWSGASVNWNKAQLYASRFESTGEVTGYSGQLFDEFAIYDYQLTNSEIIDHRSFIYNQDPNRTSYPLPITAFAESGSHNFIVTSEINHVSSVITSSSIMVNPTVVASQVVSILADTLTASASNTDVTISWGWTVNLEPALAYAESVNAFRLNNIYSNYVQTNINPYRYVTFDGNNSYADYGTDNDYAVVPTTIGGTIVNPDLGINGKSAKTAGTSYITDGVILKESEYNDTWGTGLNNYHSSFWMQKSDDDASTTGLRVLWNLNGYADNQHVVLYQYQNKLTLQFNNGSGTHITQSTTSNYDLFDGNRHFVAIAFDHTGANSYVNLFVDAVDVMTVNLGTYNGTTINGTTPVGANDEANNHPRLSIGCLITPFATTALPVIPTNTKIYVDEIIWAKSSLTPTLATNLFNIMPDKENSDFISNVFIATSLMTNVSVITTSNILSTSLDAASTIVDPELYVEAESINMVNALTVSAEMTDALMFQECEIVSDIFIATIIFNNAGVKITIPGGPMLATVTLPDETLTNGLPVVTLTPYIRYIREQNANGATIYSMKEIA